MNESRSIKTMSSMIRQFFTLKAGLTSLAMVIGMSGTANAVNLSMDGTGQVLLSPFYSVRESHVTSVSISNWSNGQTKVVKLRFRESLRGASVLDVNLFLPPRDVWSGSVIDSGSGAKLVSNDRSCTYPEITELGLPFNNLHYTGRLPGTLADDLGESLDRTREGFLEIIEMGVVADGAELGSSPGTTQGALISALVRNQPNGLPTDCSRVRVANLFASAGLLLAPKGELTASNIIIDVLRGTEFVVPGTALQRFFMPSDPFQHLYTEPGSLKPDLASVSPARSDILNPRGEEPLVFTVPDWVAAGGQPIDAVSAVLTKTEMRADYEVGNGNFQTELVLTAPTFRHYVLPAEGVSSTGFVSRPPFSVRKQATQAEVSASNADSCMTIRALAFNRDLAPYPVLTGGLPGIPRLDAGRNLAVCGPTSRVAIVPAGTQSGDGFIHSATRQTPTFFLPSNAFGGAAPQYQSGWLWLVPSGRRQDESAIGPGQVATEGADASGRPSIVTEVFSRGGVADLAPIHSDGIARRYRGLPLIGFTAIRTVSGGQGYGGMFPIQGRAVPWP